MIKPMVVDLEVDATLDDGFYYYCFFYSQKELGFTKSYLHFFFFEKSYTRVWDLRRSESNIPRWNQGLSGIIYKEFLLFIVTPPFHVCTSIPKRVHNIPTASHSSPFP